MEAAKNGGIRDGRHYRRNGPVSHINVTPLVDVMLVLLIIFMVTAPMITSGINVDLPKTNAAQIKSDNEPLTVTIGSDGNIYLGNAQIMPSQLVAKLQEAAANDQSRRIFVRGDSQISYGRIMEVMGVITTGGFTHVALLAQQPAAVPQSSP